MPQSTTTPEQTKKGPVVNVATKLNVDNPVAIDYGSDFYSTVISGQRYLPFGADDSYPNTCWQLRTQSVTQDGCLDSIAKSCIGGGIEVKNMEIEKVDPEFLAFIANVNNDNESLTDIVKTGIECIGTDGNAWPEIVMGEIADKRYIKAYMHSTLICRLGEIPKDKDRPETIIKSTRFAEKRNRIVSSRSLKAASIPIYSPNPLDQIKVWKKIENGDLTTMMHLKNAYKGSLHYGVQPSKAGLLYQYAEYKLIRFNADLLDNGMVLSGAIVFKTPMTQAEANAAAKEILFTHTGNGKNGRIAVIASESGIESFEFLPFETEKEGSYIELDTRVVEKIITANNWDAIFFGQGAEGSLGKGSTYVRGVWDLKKSTVIDPMCNYWVNNFVKPFIAIAADHLKKPEWKKYVIGFKSAMPFTYSSDINVNKVVKKNEGRQMIGLPEVKDNPAWEEPIDGAVKKENEITNVPPEPAQ